MAKSAAYVYIRQSRLQQVRQNLESGRRQYALQHRARELGFAEVVVIDDDLGISWAGHHERPGFGRLWAAVCWSSRRRVGNGSASTGLQQSRLVPFDRFVCVYANTRCGCGGNLRSAPAQRSIAAGIEGHDQ
jgi:hypothetical protein